MTGQVYRFSVSPVLTAGGLFVEEFRGTVSATASGPFVAASTADGSRPGWQGASYDLSVWHQTRAEALLEAAGQIESLIRPAVEQVERLRAEAAR